MEIKSTLREFKDVLLVWRFREKMAIGGLWALRLHGLNVREPEDLDMIVYDPSDEFLAFLLTEKGMEPGSTPVGLDGEKWRSYKVKRNGKYLNFILEWDEAYPNNLLAYEWKGHLWAVQDIGIINSAKKMYNPEKDLKDFEDFKRDNF